MTGGIITKSVLRNRVWMEMITRMNIDLSVQSLSFIEFINSVEVSYPHW